MSNQVLIHIKDWHYIICHLYDRPKDGDMYYEHNLLEDDTVIPYIAEFKNSLESYNKKYKLEYSTHPITDKVKELKRTHLLKFLGEPIPEKDALEYLGTKIVTSEDTSIVAAYLAGYDKALDHNKDKRFTLDDLIRYAKYGYEFHQNSQFPNGTFENVCINNVKQKISKENPKIWNIEYDGNEIKSND